MRTTDNAASSVASGEAPEQVYFDALFRNSKNKVVEPPVLPAGARIADTHAHLDMLHNPELALARAAVHGVSFVVTVVDPTEDPLYTLNNVDHWIAGAQKLLTEWAEQANDPAQASNSVGHPKMNTAIEEPFNTANSEPQNNILDKDFSPCFEKTKAPEVRIIIGCHPHNASKYDENVERIITNALQHNPRVVGIGEIGLDYHYDNSPRDVQQQVFARQIQLAHKHNVITALHLREAHPDGLQILAQQGLPAAGTLLHCFNLDYATLEPFLDKGCMIAYGGPLTFKKSDDVRAAAARTPLDRLLTETDSPFMAPHPLRGTVCGPEDTIFTAALLAQLVADRAALDSSSLLSPKAALEQFYNNATRFFDR